MCRFRALNWAFARVSSFSHLLKDEDEAIIIIRFDCKTQKKKKKNPFPPFIILYRSIPHENIRLGLIHKKVLNCTAITNHTEIYGLSVLSSLLLEAFP